MPANPISTRLRQLRRTKKIFAAGRLIAKGVTMEQVTEDTGISRSRQHVIENGRTEKMQLNTFLKLADYYGVTLDYLACRTNQKEPPKNEC